MIKKFLSNAMLSIVMDKSAKEKYQAVQKKRKSLKEKDKTTPEEALVEAYLKPEQEAKPEPEPSADRQELINNAMAVFKEKSSVLDSLSANEKRRLQLLAMQTMLGKDGR